MQLRERSPHPQRSAPQPEPLETPSELLKACDAAVGLLPTQIGEGGTGVARLGTQHLPRGPLAPDHSRPSSHREWGAGSMGLWWGERQGQAPLHGAGWMRGFMSRPLGSGQEWLGWSRGRWRGVVLWGRVKQSESFPGEGIPNMLGTGSLCPGLPFPLLHPFPLFPPSLRLPTSL